jgi:hypothetical protein
MITILSEPKPGTIALRFSGKLKTADYQKILPTLKDRISRFGKINVYADMEDITSMNIQALWKHVTFDIKHVKDYRKVAIVGGEKWLDTMTSISDTLTSADIRYFPPEDKSLALDWLTGKDTIPGSP